MEGKVDFSRFKNRYFIETGTFYGHGVHDALAAGCFEQIHSIELARNFYELCRFRFEKEKSVHLHCGNTVRILPKILARIDAPATIWLDAHYSGGSTACSSPLSPLLTELALLGAQPLRTHTLLIDDIEGGGTICSDSLPLDRIKEALFGVNPSYTLSLENGILLARL